MISVVIPAYNEEKHIALTLDSLLKQTTTQPFEVIVVDNNSTDKTAAVANSYKEKLPIRVVEETKKGRGAARAAGFAAAKGEIILSTDADAIVPPYWIERMVKNFTNEKIIAVTGTFQIKDCSFATNHIFNTINFYATYLYKLLYGYFWICGANCAIRKAAYNKAGGFNKNTNGMEDVELASRLRNTGRIVFDTHVTIVASGRRLKDGLLQGLSDYAQGFIAFNVYNKKDIVLDDVR